MGCGRPERRAVSGGMNERELRVQLEGLHPASFGWALRCCRGRREEAEDALQVAYLKVLDGTARFDGRSSLKTWLFTVIRRTAAEDRRRRWVRSLALGRLIARRPPDPGPPDPEADASRSETSRALLEALARLPRRQQEVLHLVYYQDLSVELASQILGISIGSARKHFDRGKRRLRSILGEEARP